MPLCRQGPTVQAHSVVIQAAVQLHVKGMRGVTLTGARQHVTLSHPLPPVAGPTFHTGWLVGTGCIYISCIRYMTHEIMALSPVPVYQTTKRWAQMNVICCYQAEARTQESATVSA